MRKIKVGDRVIGEGESVFIIAEAGVNHNGSLEIAKKMIDVAADCGADCIKFQTFKAEEFVSDRDVTYSYEIDGKVVEESMFEMFKRLELPAEWHSELFEYAVKKNLIPLSSVADIDAVNLLVNLNAFALKIASEDIINLPLLEYAASTELPIILSTGMATLNEIQEAVELIYSRGNENLILLHCTSLYPTPPDEVNLRNIDTLRQIFGVPIGYSDHTWGITASIAAVALGAVAIEKHFTLDRNMPGPDHRFSSDPVELKALVNSIRTVEKNLGIPEIGPTKGEMEMRKLCRRSIVAKVNIPNGTVITRDMLHFKRPGTGLKPREMYNIIEKKAVKDISIDEQINLDSVE